MKKLLFIVLAIALFTSCSNDNLKSSELNPELSLESETEILDSTNITKKESDSTTRQDQVSDTASPIDSAFNAYLQQEMVKVEVSPTPVVLGSNNKDIRDNEKPEMRVLLSYDYYMGIHEVTCKDFKTTLEKSKSPLKIKCKNNDIPITNITFYDAILYANAKSKEFGLDSVYEYRNPNFDEENHCIYLEGFANFPERLGFRLPTETEWIKAANTWNKQNSWNSTNSDYKVHPVCSKGKDKSGFCDLAGNVKEWVNDWLGKLRDTTITNYAGAPDEGDMDERILKGGCFNSDPSSIELYTRGDTYTITSSTRTEYVGLRIALGKIPNAIWMNDSRAFSSRIFSKTSASTIQQHLGSFDAKLVFRNDITNNLAFINYQEGNAITEIEDSINAYHPDISPDGKKVAFCTGQEGVSSISKIYVRDLEKNGGNIVKLNVEKAVIPRWHITPSGDTTLIYVSSAGNNKDESSWKKQSTWQVSFSNNQFGKPKKLFDGAYHGGISEDEKLAVSGSQLLRARMATEGTIINGKANDVIWFNNEQACNVSLTKNSSKQTAFLDFGSKTGKSFVNKKYNAHQQLFIADSTGELIDAIEAPSGYTFDHTEWTTNGKIPSIVGTLTNFDGAHKKIVLVNLDNREFLNLVEGDELWHPSLWVKKGIIPNSKTSTSKQLETSSSSEELPSSKATSSSSKSKTSNEESSSSISNFSSSEQSSSSNEFSSSAEQSSSSNNSSTNTNASSSSSSKSNVIYEDLAPDSAGYYYKYNGTEAAQWKYKMELLWQYRDSSNIIILGSSRPYNGVISKNFSSPNFATNLACPKNTLYGTRFWVKNYVLTHQHKLQYLIIGIDMDRFVLNTDYSFFYKNYKNVPGYAYDENHDFWKNGYPEGLLEYTQASPTSIGFNTISTRGYYAYSSVTTSYQDIPITEHDSTWMDSSGTNFTENLGYLKEIIEMANERKIIVIGVEFPENPNFAKTGAYGKYGIRRSEAPALLQQIKDLSGTYSNFVFYDANNMGNHDYPKVEFYDNDHLCQKGAERITQRLDSLISTLTPLR